MSLNRGTEKKQPYLRITAGPQRNCYVHRLIAEAMLGRPLRKDETVHHKDGNTLNNRWTNLEVLLLSDHARLGNAEAKRKAGLTEA